MKVNEIKVEKKYNLGNFEMITLAVGLSPEQQDHISSDYEKMISDEIQKISNILDANKNKIIAKRTEGG